jgi:formylglycine-generating enzyme
MNMDSASLQRFDGMVHLAGGIFTMGSDRHYPEERPAHRVRVPPFWMDRCAVTNRQFSQFIESTDYVTLAQKAADPALYPGADPSLLVPSSIVLVPPSGPVGKDNIYNWWQYVPGANWRHPRGPDSSLLGLDDHPVVHVAYEDALAYAMWIGKELPTEAEWEYACKGGSDETDFPWGDELAPGGQHMANTWQGEFPWENLKLDGYEFTAPVGSFPANGYGLYDMIGNVWEWTTDWYRDHAVAAKTCCTADNPRGGDRDGSIDAGDVARIPRRVTKGGSHACAPSYCRRYRPAARMAQPVDTSTSHIGFRCIVRANAPAA